jgi:hypothetical protein
MTDKSCDDYKKALLELMEATPDQIRIAKDMARHGNVMYRVTPTGIRHIARREYDIWYKGGGGC